MCSSRSASTFSRMELRFLSAPLSTRSLLSSLPISSSCSVMSFIFAFCARGSGGAGGQVAGQLAARGSWSRARGGPGS